MNLAAAWKRIDAYERLVRLDKPIGTLLLLWPTLWALWVATHGRPLIAQLAIFLLGTVLMRSAGCAMNDWADRDFDGYVKRTRDRPLAAREILPAEALMVGAILAALAFGLVLFLNRFALLLSFVALAIACLYPFTKRVFPLPQIFLGVAFAFGVPMAFAAVANALPWPCWLLFAAGILYGFAYDTEYAMVDRDDDLKIGMRTSAITFGRYDVAAVLASYASMLALLAWLGFALGYAWPYWAGLAVAGGLAASHYPMIRTRSREGCFHAFRHANWIGLAVFAGIALTFELQYRL